MKYQALQTANSADVIFRWAKQLINDLNSAKPLELPIGAMLVWPNADIPLSWLVCDGSVVDTADYPMLFLALGNTAGATFNLPTAYPAAPESAGFNVIIRAL